MKQLLMALGVTGCLAGGLGMYLFYRSPDLLMFHWLKQWGLYAGMMNARANVSVALWPWLYESMPYGLWNLSLGMALCMVWKRKMVVQVRWGILLITFLSGVFVELMQAACVIRGTFDPVDLTVLTISFFIVYFITLKTPIHEKAIS